jgi:hypothetical protein
MGSPRVTKLKVAQQFVFQGFGVKYQLSNIAILAQLRAIFKPSGRAKSTIRGVQKGMLRSLKWMSFPKII